MGLRQVLDRVLGRAEGDIRTRSLFGNQIALIDPSTLSPFLPPTAGNAIAAQPLKSLAVPAVYRAVSMISSSVATMPWASWDPETNTLVQRQPTILRKPDPFEPRNTTLRAVTASMLLYGEAFLVLGALVDGRPTSAIPVPNSEVVVTWNASRTRARYHWRNTELFQYRTILHMRYLELPGVLHGLGPIQMARQSVAGGVLADTMATDYYQNGITDGVLESPEKLSAPEAERLAKQWGDGSAMQRGTPVLEGGVQYKPISMSNSDAQFIEGRNFTVQDIGRLFGIPAPLLNATMSGSSLQYRNQEGIATEYATQAVQPVSEALETQFGELIASTQVIRFDFSKLLRADAPTRYRVYDLALRNHILTINEVRRLEGLAPIPGGGDIPETAFLDENAGGIDLTAPPSTIQQVEVMNE